MSGFEADSYFLPAGTRLGEFQVLSLIGQGGFGIVYLALDHSLQRRVAVKEYMPAQLASRRGGSTTVSSRTSRDVETFELGLRSFVNEARLLAQFDHPALLKVHRFWQANGTAYMAMPFYEGPTFKQSLTGMEARPDEEWLRALFDPLLDACATLHAARCFHRDISPDNILLTKAGPILLDFGAARRVIAGATKNLTVILKEGYAPIEQYGDSPSMVQGPWTDIYALCGVLRYAITGEIPPSAVQRLMGDRMEPLRESHAGEYSAEFLGAIDAGLAIKPGDRPQDVAELRKSLDRSGDATTRLRVAHPRQGSQTSASAGRAAIAHDLAPSFHPKWWKRRANGLIAGACIGIALLGFQVYFFREGGRARLTSQPFASDAGDIRATNAPSSEPQANGAKGSGPGDPPNCRAVRFSDVGWSDVTSTTALAAQLLRSIGYTPTVTVLSVPATFASLKNKDVDVFLGNWMPVQTADRAAYLADGSVAIVGPNLLGAKYTLAVPSYTFEAGLTDFKDIQRFRRSVNDSIYGIESGNDGNRLVLKMIKENRFGLGDFKLIESSEQAMLAEVERASRAKKPIVFLAWEPHPMNIRFDIRYLTGGDEIFGANFGGATVYTVARRGYTAECPNVGRLLTNLSFTLRGESEMMAAIFDRHEQPQIAASAWLKANPAVVKAWLKDVRTPDGRSAL